VDVAGIEPATPCLQSWEEKTLKALSGVANTETQRNFRSLSCPDVVPSIPVLAFPRCRGSIWKTVPSRWDNYFAPKVNESIPFLGQFTSPGEVPGNLLNIRGFFLVSENLRFHHQVSNCI
jgi:hypothetical protein